MTDTDTDTDIPTTEAGAIAAVAMMAAGSELVETVAGRRGALIVPKGCEVHDIDLERYAPHPARHAGTARLRDRRSFVAYVEQVVGPDRDWEGQIGYYADPDTLQVAAVFNDHGGFPGWCDFRAVLALERTPEWLAWTEVNKQLTSAAVFADFVEDWQHTILEPDAASIRDMVRSFRATQKVTFGDEIIDKSGDRSLQYTTETTATAGRGDLPIPDVFTLEIRPFIGAEVAELQANFRYRLEGGRATFGVSLVQPDKALRDAFENEVLEITGAVGDQVMLGTPAGGQR